MLLTTLYSVVYLNRMISFIGVLIFHCLSVSYLHFCHVLFVSSLTQLSLYHTLFPCYLFQVLVTILITLFFSDANFYTYRGMAAESLSSDQRLLGTSHARDQGPVCGVPGGQGIAPSLRSPSSDTLFVPVR